jgi:hypothetical protein
MERLHKWDKDDTILTLYYVKYDLKGLPVKDEKDLAEGIIGSTKASLQMQAANVRFVLGYDNGVLDCFSDIQKKVVDEYNDKSFDELKQISIDIILKRDVNGNLQKVKDAQKLKEVEKKKKEQQKELEDIFRKMGKDPSKMKKVAM